MDDPLTLWLLIQPESSRTIKTKAGDFEGKLKLVTVTTHLVWFFIVGKCKVTVGDDNVTIAKFQLLAMSATATGHMTAEEPSRFLFCSVAKDPTQSPKPYIVRNLEEMIGTERDVDFQHGRSRRYLVKRDGYNISTHNTLCYANLVSPMAYVNQVGIDCHFYCKWFHFSSQISPTFVTKTERTKFCFYDSDSRTGLG